MANAPGSGQWPPYPHIPIFLETCDDNGISRSYDTITPVSPCPEIHPQRGAVRALAAASTQFTNLSANISTNVSPISTANQNTSVSPAWPLPEPPPEVNRLPPKRPTLQFFPTSKPRLQFGGGTLFTKPPARPPSVTSTIFDSQSREESDLGLGIENGSRNSHTIPDPSPIREKRERSSNIAQVIEQKLWRYNSSGNIVKRWLLEIISWWISALCMGTIVGVLIYYQDKKLPNWPGVLTLNAFIAILSKISGAALVLPVSEALGQLKWSWFQGDSKKMWDFEIFDNASRGPWGSILLLIRTKGRALAALGALITLLSLALDPFFQQVVDFPERWTLHGNSSIPRVIEWVPQTTFELQSGVGQVVNDQDLQAVAEKFFYDNGTQPLEFGNGTRPDIPLSCPTGNCTWPAYDTLAMCSQCVDVSQMLTYACRTIRVDWLSDSLGADFADTYPNGTMCGYFLNATSEAPVLMSGYLVNANSTTGDALLGRSLPLVTNPDRATLYGGSINFKHIRNPMVNVLIASVKNGTHSVYGNEAPAMSECVFHWCIQRIKSTYYQATYEEEVIETFTNTSAGAYPWVTIPFISETQNGTDIYYHDNISLHSDDPTTIFGLTNETMLDTVGALDDIFPSWTSATNSSADPMLRYKFYKKDPFTKSLKTNPWLLPNNVTLHMERMATALTNVMRKNSGESFSGTAYNQENFVSVRWEWLGLPLGLLFSSLFFLIATVRKTAKEEGRIGVWKTSAIATLLYGLPDEMQEKITRSSSKQGTPRAKAKKLRVKIHPKTGWRVSGNLFSPATPNMKRNRPPPGWI